MKNPFDFFEVIYCLNLPERTDRYQQSKEEFRKIGIVDKVVYVPGKKYNYTADPKRNSAIGNHKSHAYCLQRSKDLFYNNCLIFEDDVNFFYNQSDTYRILDSVINSISPNWDMLYLGANLDVYKAVRQTDYLARLTGAFATHAYAVNKQMFDELITINDDVNTIHNDVTYANQVIPNHEVYITIPMLAGQSDGYSTVEQKVVSYNNMMLERFAKGLVDG